MPCTLTKGFGVFRVTGTNLETFLGVRKFLPDRLPCMDQVGLVTGLAWTSVGGETLEVEVNVMDGSGKLELTGNLGDVMKESAMVAMGYIRSQADKYNIDKELFTKKDIHIHVPEGAVPKDGPSAGITMATAMLSAIIKKPVRADVAMTGEITLRGRILPIGGLKEKVIGSHRAGIKNIFIPEENIQDLDEIPEDIKNEITFEKGLMTMQNFLRRNRCAKIGFALLLVLSLLLTLFFFSMFLLR